MPSMCCLYIFVINTTAYSLGRFKPSSPSTKWLHGSAFGDKIDITTWNLGNLIFEILGWYFRQFAKGYLVNPPAKCTLTEKIRSIVMRSICIEVLFSVKVDQNPILSTRNSVKLAANVWDLGLAFSSMCKRADRKIRLCCWASCILLCDFWTKIEYFFVLVLEIFVCRASCWAHRCSGLSARAKGGCCAQTWKVRHVLKFTFMILKYIKMLCPEK